MLHGTNVKRIIKNLLPLAFLFHISTEHMNQYTIRVKSGILKGYRNFIMICKIMSIKGYKFVDILEMEGDIITTHENYQF